MSAHVLLNLLNELRKRDKYEDCRAFYLFFATSLITFNKTGARMLDFIYQMTFRKYFEIMFWRDNVRVLPYA